MAEIQAMIAQNNADVEINTKRLTMLINAEVTIEPEMGELSFLWTRIVSPTTLH